MFRVDRISLPAESPVGPVTVGSDTCRLADYDLVIIEGRNGAGKTSIVRPLCSWSRDTTTRWIGDPAAKPTDSEARSGIEDWLLSKSSLALMKQFDFPEDALASVSGIGRLHEEIEILKKLVPDDPRPTSKYPLLNLAPPDDATRDHAVELAIHYYRQCERVAWEDESRLPDDAALTLAQYDAWGRQAAEDAGKTWPGLAVIDDGHMRAAEDQIRPREVVIEGSIHLRSAASELVALTQAAPANKATAALSASAAEVARRTEELKSLLPSGAPDGAMSIDEQCTRDLARLTEQAAALRTQAKTIDELLMLQADAKNLLEQSNATTCPVCQQAIDQRELIARLAETTTNGASASLREQATSLDSQQAELERCKSALDAAIATQSTHLSTARGWLRNRKAQLDTFATRVTAQDGWDRQVVDIARVLDAARRDIAFDMDNLDDSQVVETIASVDERLTTLVRECGEAVTRLHEESERRNAGVRRAEKLHRRLGVLRPILVATRALNAKAWSDRRQERQKNDAKRARINVWIEAVREEIRKRNKQVGKASATILDDKGVRQRFQMLLEATGHPLTTGAQLKPGKVVSKDETAIAQSGRGAAGATKMSEGFTVLLNIAAFLAIAGSVSPNQQHQAGWVLLDEPTNGLDPRNRQRLAEYLGGLTLDLVPKQIFVTTFEDEFAELLVKSAARVGRRVLRVRLDDWTGSSMSAPSLTPILHQSTG
jgi:DNA repair exonuclease SbcCD ATPase subunit